jgi:hypothetical protein
MAAHSELGPRAGPLAFNVLTASALVGISSPPLAIFAAAVGASRPRRFLIDYREFTKRTHRDAVQLAAQMMKHSAADGERHLGQQLRRQAHVMRRKGIQATVIERELKSLEAAVRGTLWRWLLGPWSGGAV